MLASGLTDSIGRDTYLKPFFFEQALAKQRGGALLLADFSGHTLMTTSRALQKWIDNAALIKEVIASKRPHAEIVDNKQLIIVYPVIFPPTESTRKNLLAYSLELPILLGHAATDYQFFKS